MAPTAALAAPVAATATAAPVAPAAKVAPVAPAAKVAPVAPAAKVAPVAPAARIAPVAPATAKPTAVPAAKCCPAAATVKHAAPAKVAKKRIAKKRIAKKHPAAKPPAAAKVAPKAKVTPAVAIKKVSTKPTLPVVPKNGFFVTITGPKSAVVPLTRREYVEAVDRWIKYFESVSSRSIAQPMDGVVMYSDLTGVFKETALSLERKYRLFDGVEDFHLGMFDANAPIDRLQAAQLLANVVTLIERRGLTRNLDIRRPGFYTDLDDMEVEGKDINLLTSRGIMVGLEDNIFSPATKLSRPQFDEIQTNFKSYLDRCQKAL